MEKGKKVNYWVVFVATIVNYVLGFLWYSPQLFGEIWAKALGITLPDGAPPFGSILGSLIFTFIAMWAIAYALKILDKKGLKEGVIVSLFFCIFIILPNLIGQWLFANKFDLFIINFGFVLVGYTISGMILGKLQK